MKLKGKRIDGPTEEVIPIIRGDEEIIFLASAVMDWDKFEKLCPEPEPPKVLRPGETVATPNLKDKKYLERIETYSKRRTAYMITQSLNATEGLEWEMVDEEDPTTWEKYTEDFKKGGLSDVEINRLIIGVMAANGLDDTKIVEAKKRFLAHRLEVENKQSTSKAGQANT